MRYRIIIYTNRIIKGYTLLKGYIYMRYRIIIYTNRIIKGYT